MKDIFGIIGGALLGIVVILIAIAFVPFVGYVVGMVLAMIPFISDWLTFNGALDKSQFPSITAWLAVAGIFLRASVSMGADKK